MIINNFRKVLDRYNSGHKKLSLRKLAKITGSPLYSITALYNGKAKGIKFNVLNKLVQFFNVPMTDIISYQGNLMKFRLMNADKFIKYFTNDHKLPDFLRNSGHYTYLKHSTILSCNKINFMFTIERIRHHKIADQFISSISTAIKSLLSRKSDRFMNVTIDSLLMNGDSSSKSEYINNVIDHFNNDLKLYILFRTLFQSGLLNINKADNFMYSFEDGHIFHDIDTDNIAPVKHISDYINWPDHLNHYKNIGGVKYPYLHSVSNNHQIRLLDQTTDDFSK